MHYLEKQPGEVEVIAVDYEDRLASSVTISSATAKVTNEAGTDVTTSMVSGSPTVVGTQVQVRLKDGTAGATYYLAIKATVSTGDVYEEDVQILVVPQPGATTPASIRNWVRTMLGAPTVQVELTDGQIDICIQNALDLFNRHYPRVDLEEHIVPQGYWKYTPPDPGHGVLRVDFLNPEQLTLGVEVNIFGIVPYRVVGGPFSEYAVLLTAVESFRRTVSGDPDWEWNESDQSLYVYCPSRQYLAGVYFLRPRTVLQIPEDHRLMFRELTMAYLNLGPLYQIRGKFGGRIPAPDGSPLQLNAMEIKTRGEQELDRIKKALLSEEQSLFAVIA